MLGYIPHKKDQVDVWNEEKQTYNIYAFMQPDATQPGYWYPSEPVIDVGQAFYIKSTMSDNVWNLTYPVGQ